jgi:hypothetical protein
MLLVASVKIEVLENLRASSAQEYDDLVSSSEYGMFYHSLRYLRLLTSVVEADPIIILCYDSGQVAGALPAFIKRDKNSKVLNSLPFFGSHGGVVIRRDIDESRAREVVRGTLAHLKEEVWRQNDLTVSTIITSPYEKETNLYNATLDPEYSEKRATQMLTIPEVHTEQELMRTFEKRCRWAIRKAQNNNVVASAIDRFEPGMIDKLYEMHVENSAKAEAPAKPRIFFDKIGEIFLIHRDYDIYVAEHRDVVIAALLVFYFGRFVEYFVPTVKAEYRNLNPMNLIVLKSMSSAIQRNLRIWNFGGTRETWSGVYLFKRSFGARDYTYHYFTSIASDPSALLQLTAAEVRSAYPWFYVLPYTVLRK